MFTAYNGNIEHSATFNLCCGNKKQPKTTNWNFHEQFNNHATETKVPLCCYGVGLPLGKA